MGAQGTTTINFGSFPGVSDASVAVTGQAAITGTSLVEAWLFPVATADHTADEHMVETIRVVAGNIIAGTGFTIYAFNTSQLNEPVLVVPGENSFNQTGTTITNKNATPGKLANLGGNGTLIYGQWTVAWVWN